MNQQQYQRIWKNEFVKHALRLVQILFRVQFSGWLIDFIIVLMSMDIISNIYNTTHQLMELNECEGAKSVVLISIVT